MYVYSISTYFAVCPLSFSLVLLASLPTSLPPPYHITHLSFAHAMQSFTIASSFSLTHSRRVKFTVCLCVLGTGIRTLHGPSFSSPYPKIKKKAKQKKTNVKSETLNTIIRKSRDNVKSGMDPIWKLDCFEKVSLKFSIRNIMSAAIHSCLWKIERLWRRK